MGSQAGFTLIELLASLTILAVGILAATRVMDSAFFMAGQGGNRTRAVALATREAESLRAAPYDQLGFSVLQPGYVATFEGAPTVTVASPAVTPTTPDQAAGGITYRFQRYVTWANPSTAGSGGTVCTAGYKRVTVIVGWTDQGGTHSARQDSYVYPGGRGQCGASTTSTTAGSGASCQAPTTLNAILGPTDTATTVTLMWTPPVLPATPIASYRVEYSTDLFLTAHVVTNSQPPDTTTYAVTGLSPGTTYQFRVSSVISNGSACAAPTVATTTTAMPATTTTTLPVGVTTTTIPGTTTTTQPACRVGSMTVTSNAIVRASSGSKQLAANAVASVNTIGVCAGLQIAYSPSDGVIVTAFLSVTNGGNQVATINGNATWDTGSHIIAVLDQSGTKVLATATLTVCAWNKSCP